MWISRKTGRDLSFRVNGIIKELQDKEIFLAELQKPFEQYLALVRQSTYVSEADIPARKLMQIEHLKTVTEDIKELRRLKQQAEELCIYINTENVNMRKPYLAVRMPCDAQNYTGFVVVDRVNNSMHLVVNNNGMPTVGYVWDEKTLQQMSKEHKGEKVINLPYLVLLYRQFIKKSATYNISAVFSADTLEDCLLSLNVFVR